MSSETNKNRGYVLVRSVVMIMSCLVVLAAVLSGISSGRSKARDVQRAQDVATIAKALKTYKEYNLKYPEALNGRAKDLGLYLEYWPQPPKADGNCPGDNNVYMYEQLDRGQSYHLTFCLGKSVSGYAAGYNVVQP